MRCKLIAPRCCKASPSTSITRVPPHSAPRPAGCTTAAAPRCTCALALALALALSLVRFPHIDQRRTALLRPVERCPRGKWREWARPALCAVGAAHRQVQGEAARGPQGREGFWRLRPCLQVLGALLVAAPLGPAARAGRLRGPRHLPRDAPLHAARGELCAACGSNQPSADPTWLQCSSSSYPARLQDRSPPPAGPAA